MSKVDGPAAIAACANLRSRNARSLFISGPTAAARDAGDISSYQPQKSLQHLVADPGGQAAAVGVVAEQRGDVGQGDQPGAGRHRAEQGQARGAEDVVGAGSPEPGEDPPEDPGDVVHDHVGVGAGPVALQHVQARRRRAGVAGVEQHDLARRVLGEAGEQVGHGVALGVDEDDAAPGVGVGEDLPGDQGGLAGAGRPADPQVVPGVGDRQADRAGRPGVGDAQRADARAGERDGGRRRDGACPGAGQAGQRRVGGQPGDRREFRHGQQVAPGQPPGADHGGGAAQPAAGQPVPPGEQGGGRGQGVGQAAQPGRLLRGGGPPLPAAGPVAGLGGGGGGDRVADQGFPLRPGELGGGLADLGGQLGIGAAGGPAAAAAVAPGLARSSSREVIRADCPDALLAGGAAGLAEPGSGDRPGQDLQDGVLAVGEAGRGPGQRPQRRLRVMAGRQRQDVRAGQPQRARRRRRRRAAAAARPGR